MTRRLDRDLPRLEMRAPALIARQVARGITRDLPRRADPIAPPDARPGKAAAMLAAAERDARAIIGKAMNEAAALREEAGRLAAGIVARARSEATAILDAAMSGDTSAGDRRPVAAIIAEVAAAHGLSARDITGASRSDRVVAARWAAIAAAYVERPDMSTTQLGRAFGDRDHSTILHAVRKAGVHRGRAR